MDDHRIEVFLSTVKCGSFSKAAEELHITQSAITQTMNHFEDELGLKLLKRQHNGISLTEEGQALLPYIMEVDAAIRKLKNGARDYASLENTPIRIGAYSSVANTFLPGLIRDYQLEHEDISFQILIGYDHLSSWLVNGEVDLVFADEKNISGARWYPLIKDPYLAAIPEDLLKDKKTDIVTRSLLSELPFIMANNYNYSEYLPEMKEKAINVLCDDDSSLLHMVSQGLGAALLPELSLKNPPGNVRILPIDMEVYRTIGLGVPNTTSKRVKDFAAFVTEQMNSK